MSPRSVFALGVGGLAAVVALGFGVWKQLGVKSYGHPAGRVVRAGQRLCVLMETCDPYMPSLKGRSESDMSYSYELWAIPESGDGKVEKVRLARGVPSEHRTHNIGAQAFDRGLLWVAIEELQGIDLEAGRLVEGSPPASLVNAPISQLMGTGEFPLEQYRSQSVAVPSGDVLALVNDDEVKVDLKVGARLYDGATPKGTYKARGFHVVKGDGGVVPRIAGVARLGEREFRNGAFMRSTKGGPVVRFTGPDGFLVVYDAGDPVKPTVHFSRVSMDGTVVWTADTGVGRLTQLLPHDSMPVLVGEPPQQLTEPMLSVVHLKDGTVKTMSLKGPLN